MVELVKENVNPKNRKTGDCTTRALVKLLGISWEEALTKQYEHALKSKYSLYCKQTEELVLADYGFVKMKQPKKADGTKYCVGEIDKLIGNKPAYITMANHATCYKDGKIVDTWDCRRKKIGNYYIKEKGK